MKTHRFFVNQNIENFPEITIADPVVIHQMKNVLRLQIGDPVIFLNGTDSEYHSKVKVISKKESIFSVEEIKKVDTKVEQKINLVPALLKKDKFEWVLQKCTELGVKSFSPIISERTEKTKLNLDRGNIIIKEAAEQSERATLPTLNEPVFLEEFLKKETKNSIQNIYVLDFCETKIDVSHIKTLNEVTVLIGPEGGWGEGDKKLFEQYEIKIVSLGDRVLRAETASVGVASLISLG